MNGPLLFWVTRQKLRGHELTPAEIAARQVELIAQLGAGAGATGE
jgi:hypothetical protein